MTYQMIAIVLAAVSVVLNAILFLSQLTNYISIKRENRDYMNRLGSTDESDDGDDEATQGN